MIVEPPSSPAAKNTDTLPGATDTFVIDGGSGTVGSTVAADGAEGDPIPAPFFATAVHV